MFTQQQTFKPIMLHPTWSLQFVINPIAALITFLLQLQLIWWHSFWAHTAFLVACSSTSVWKGATYQFDIFAHRYLDSVGLEPRKKKAA